MSATRIGDRYECNATVACPCGCGRAYCRSCFGRHCEQAMPKLMDEVEALRAFIAKEGQAATRHLLESDNVCAKHIDFNLTIVQAIERLKEAGCPLCLLDEVRKLRG